MIERVHKTCSESFLRMLPGIICISAKEIPSVRIAAPYHPFVTFPSVSAQTFKVFFYKLCCFVLILEHGRKLLQQFCLAAFSLALGFGKSLFELLQFFALFGLFPPSPLPVRAFCMRYRYPVAAVIVYLCLKKVHFTPPRNSTRRIAALSFVLFSCKFLSSEVKICTKKRA